MTPRRWLGAALAFAIALAGTAQAAELEPRESSEPPPLEFEAGRTAAQYALGIGTVLAGTLLIASNQSDDGGLIALALTPGVVGALVCKVGLEGQHDGSCAITILGSYLGAATMIPLGYLGYLTDPNVRRDDGRSHGEPYYGNAIIGVAIGWVIMQPLGATLGWHLSRSPKPPVTVGPPLPSPRPRFGVSEPRRRRGLAASPAVTVPWLSLRF